MTHRLAAWSHLWGEILQNRAIWDDAPWRGQGCNSSRQDDGGAVAFFSEPLEYFAAPGEAHRMQWSIGSRLRCVRDRLEQWRLVPPSAEDPHVLRFDVAADE